LTIWWKAVDVLAVEFVLGRGALAWTLMEFTSVCSIMELTLVAWPLVIAWLTTLLCASKFVEFDVRDLG